jgi:hypothetical protein
MASTLVEQTAWKTTTTRPRRRQEALLSNMDLPLWGTFYPLGYAVEFITNDAIVLEIANETFGHAHRADVSVRLEVRIAISEGGY